MQDPQQTVEILLVTGPSGAGRTTAIRVLEDAGYEVIDNLPLSMLPRLLSADTAQRQPLALGIDVRNRDFSVDGLLSALEVLRAAPGLQVKMVYLDCAADQLIARFSETRRRHPLAPQEDAAIGVARELALIADVPEHADVVIDTTALTVHDLRDEILRWFGQDVSLAVSVQSFSYKRGLPRGLDLVFDLRFRPLPHWVPALREGTGQDPAVRDHVTSDPRFADFFERMSGLLLATLPAYREEGRAHLAIGLGCTGGRHRSVAVAELLADALAAGGWRVSKRHRELERRSASLPAGGLQQDLASDRGHGGSAG